MRIAAQLATDAQIALLRTRSRFGTGAPVALRRTLPSTEWQALTAGRAGLPSWMARAIGEAIVEQETRG